MENIHTNRIISVLFISCLMVSGLSTGEESNQKKANRSISVNVDPRVELMSIIFRLAGNPEYNRSQFFSYIGDIETHFGQFKEHPVVKLAKQLRNSKGVGFDAVMSMAIYIKDINDFNLLVPFDSLSNTLDSRWDKQNIVDFLDKAEQFARESKFIEFFNAHKSMYDKATEQFSLMMDKESHLEWFDEFFGARPGAEFYIYLGMTNGPSNYGPKIKLAGKEKYYCVLGAWKISMLGFGEPRFDKSMLPTIIHEFCHSYTNPIVDVHESEIENAGKRIYALVENQMKRNAYGYWLIVMRESMVRACVVRYMAKNEGPDSAKAQIKSDISRGFLWMQELSDLLIEYDEHRDEYPTLDDFFPKVIEFFNNYNKN
jgi:hypothetical protein